MRISDVLKSKTGPGVVTIGPDATIRELLTQLAEHNIGAVIVSGDGSRLDGIVSERDVVRRLHEDDDLLSKPVESIMTRSVNTCEPDQELDEVLSLMTEQRFRHAPVVDNGAVNGIVSIGDLVKHKIEELQFERDQLDSYVRQS